MEIARIRVRQTTMELDQSAPVTRGMVGAAVVFEHFGPEWAGLSKTAVFRTGTASGDVVNVQEGQPVVIPWEVLDTLLEELQVGICGHNSDGTLVISTVWGTLGKITPGAAPVGRPSEPPTPDWTAQIEGQVNQALTEVQAVRPLTRQAVEAASAASDHAAATADADRRAARAAQHSEQQANESKGAAEAADHARNLAAENAQSAANAKNAAVEAADRAAASEQTADTAARNALAQGNRAEAEANRAKDFSDRIGDIALVGTSLGVQGARAGDFFQAKAVDSRGRVTEWTPQTILTPTFTRAPDPSFEIVAPEYTSVQVLGKIVYIYVTFKIKAPDNWAWKTLLQDLPVPYNKGEMIVPVLTRTGKGPCRVKLQNMEGSWNLVAAGGEASVDFMDMYDVAYAYLME